MINHVVILGRLTKTPMLQNTNSGRKSTFISIATTTYNAHMKRNKTNYVSIKLWGRTAEYVVKKGKKGMGNRNSNHSPPIKRKNFHLSLILVYKMLPISFNLDDWNIKIWRTHLHLYWPSYRKLLIFPYPCS